MDKVYKHIRFNEWAPDGRKTRAWTCLSNSNAAPLGTVKWFGRWRQYCFFPEDDCVFSVGCMEDINTFIRECMDAWREEKKRAK